MNEHLMRTVLYSALFFETCLDEECDPDMAVKQLEGIAAELEGLSAAEKDEFRNFARREAAKHPVASVGKEITELVDAMFAEE